MTGRSCLACLALACASLGATPPGDDTAALQLAIDALPRGGTLVLEARTYHFQGLRLPRSASVIGRGAGRTLCVRTAAAPFFRISGRDAEVAIRQLDLDGGGLCAAGIEADGVRTLRLDGVRVAHCGTPPPGSLPGDAHGKPVDGVYARDVDRAEVSHCLFQANARDGFIGIPVRRLFFAHNTSRDNGRMGCTSDLDPEGRLGGPLQVVYQDNEVVACGTGGLHVESAPGLPVVDARFEGNRVTGCGDRDWGYSWGLVLGRNGQGALRGNTVTATGLKSSLRDYRNGILVARPGGPVVIADNTIQGSGRSGIAVSESAFPVILSRDTVRGALASGIAAYRLSALKVEGCTVEGSGQWGFWCRLCPSARVLGNRFLGNGLELPGSYAAMRAEASADLSLKDNDLGGPPQSMGLELQDNLLGAFTHLEGNTFQGQRRHPRLSSFLASN